MTWGPGKYDDLTTYVRESAEAQAVVVVVLGGKHGPGFSVQVVTEAPADALEALAQALQSCVTQLQRDAQQLRRTGPS